MFNDMAVTRNYSQNIFANEISESNKCGVMQLYVDDVIMFCQLQGILD